MVLNEKGGMGSEWGLGLDDVDELDVSKGIDPLSIYIPQSKNRSTDRTVDQIAPSN